MHCTSCKSLVGDDQNASYFYCLDCAEKGWLYISCLSCKTRAPSCVTLDHEYIVTNKSYLDLPEKVKTFDAIYDKVKTKRKFKSARPYYVSRGRRWTDVMDKREAQMVRAAQKPAFVDWCWKYTLSDSKWEGFERGKNMEFKACIDCEGKGIYTIMDPFDYCIKDAICNRCKGNGLEPPNAPAKRVYDLTTRTLKC